MKNTRVLPRVLWVTSAVMKLVDTLPVAGFIPCGMVKAPMARA